MPLYEYECKSCGARVEEIQRFSDPPLATCGRCGGPLRRLLSPPAVQFKGSGWYVTDYAGRSRGKAAGGEKAAEKPSETAAAAGSAAAGTSPPAGAKTGGD